MRLLLMAAAMSLVLWLTVAADQPVPRKQYPAEIGLYAEDSHITIPDTFTGTMVVVWPEYDTIYRIENGQIWSVERVSKCSE